MRPNLVQGVLRAKVDALIAEQTGQWPSGAAERGTARPEPAQQVVPTGREQADELALRRHRRRTPWLVAAAVAGIVAAGGGGYVAGESGLGIRPATDASAGGGTEQAPSVMAEPDATELEGRASGTSPSPRRTGRRLRWRGAARRRR